jgi:ribosomal protein S18 acetylase RimI-like enzyme
MVIYWCSDHSEIPVLAEFFAIHVTPDYISHGEIQTGRAEEFDRWSPDLVEVVAEEMRGALAFADSNSSIGRRRILAARSSGDLVALAIVRFQAARFPYGVIEDVIVDRALRGQEIGSRVLEWIEQRAREQGISRLFLESNSRNRHAHAFFKKHNFNICSVIMVKTLD